MIQGRLLFGLFDFEQVVGHFRGDRIFDHSRKVACRVSQGYDRLAECKVLMTAFPQL